MTCQEAIEVMGDAVEGRLAPEFRPGFDAHMTECRPCATYYEHLQVTRSLLRALPRERHESPRRTELIGKFRKRLQGRAGRKTR